MTDTDFDFIDGRLRALCHIKLDRTILKGFATHTHTQTLKIAHAEITQYISLCTMCLFADKHSVLASAIRCCFKVFGWLPKRGLSQHVKGGAVVPIIVNHAPTVSIGGPPTLLPNELPVVCDAPGH